jgi:CheY-like chemotaxis protein
MGGDGSVVLVIEDEWLLRDCVAAHLRAAGWRTLETRSGEAAVQLLETGQPIDIVFTDIQLAGAMSGWEVGTRFREKMPDIPIIYTSGAGSNSALAVPKSIFVAKPYRLEAIEDACCTLAIESRRPC